MYVTGEGNSKRREDVVMSVSGVLAADGWGEDRLPPWAKDSPEAYWAAADRLENFGKTPKPSLDEDGKPKTKGRKLPKPRPGEEVPSKKEVEKEEEKERWTYSEWIIGFHHEYSMAENLEELRETLRDAGLEGHMVTVGVHLTFDPLRGRMYDERPLADAERQLIADATEVRERKGLYIPDGYRIEDFHRWPEGLKRMYQMHAHVMISPRFAADGIQRDTPEIFFHRKAPKWKNPKREYKPETGGAAKDPLGVLVGSRKNNRAFREIWKTRSNARLQAHGFEPIVDFSKFRDRGTKELPLKRLSPADFERERRFERTEAGDVNRAIVKHNERVRQLEREGRRLDRVGRLLGRLEREGHFSGVVAGHFSGVVAGVGHKGKKATAPEYLKRDLMLVRGHSLGMVKQDLQAKFEASRVYPDGLAVLSASKAIRDEGGGVARPKGEPCLVVKQAEGEVRFAYSDPLPEEMRAAALLLCRQGFTSVRVKGEEEVRQAFAEELGRAGLLAKGEERAVSERALVMEAKRIREGLGGSGIGRSSEAPVAPAKVDPVLRDMRLVALASADDVAPERVKESSPEFAPDEGEVKRVSRMFPPRPVIPGKQGRGGIGTI
jgi:hypothetical protein